MERKLKSLFDYQKFEKNPRLEKLISETENRYARELSDDDLSFVNAAGDFNMSGDQFMKWWEKNNKPVSEAVSNADGTGVYHDGTEEEASWKRN